MQFYIMEQKLSFWVEKHVLLKYQNTNRRRFFIFFIGAALVTRDDAMLSDFPSRLPEIRNMGAAKQPRRPSNPVLPYQM